MEKARVYIIITGVVVTVGAVIFHDKLKPMIRSIFDKANEKMASRNKPDNTPGQDSPLPRQKVNQYISNRPIENHANHPVTRPAKTPDSSLDFYIKSFYNKTESIEQQLLNLEKNLKEYIFSSTQNLNARLDDLSRRINERQPPVTPPSDMADTRKKSTFPYLLYAESADITIKGFRENRLSPFVQYAMFELTINSPADASFRISPDNDIRMQLLSMPSIIGFTCDIVSNAPNATTIADVSDGKLKKEGDSWIITKKAAIKFV